MRNYYLILAFLSIDCFSHTEDLGVIKSALSGFCKSSNEYILQSEAIDPPPLDQINESLIKDVGGDLIAALYALKSSLLISDKICSRIDVEKMSTIKMALEGKKEVKNPVFEDEHWNNFYDVFPGVDGVIYVSRVAYSDNRKLAIIFLASACGPLCGGSSFIVMSYNKKKWIRLKSVQFSQQ